MDDNLLHGQIAFSWVRSLHLHEILIADDNVAKDEFTKMTLGLSKPAGVKLKIMNIEDGIAEMKNNVDGDMNLMVIVNSIENAYSIIEKVKSIRSLNVGLLRTDESPAIQYDSMAMGKNDVKLCLKMIDEGTSIEYRLRYDDPSVKIVKDENDGLLIIKP